MRAHLWQVDEPPADFADRVAAAALVGEKRRVTRRALLALSAVACSALAAYELDRRLPPHVRELTARVRAEVELTPGVVAVVERGARLMWDRFGVRQQQGDVSYRVAPSATLNLETPLGRVVTGGSCCRIKLADPIGALFVSVSHGALDVTTRAAMHASLHEGQYARVTSLGIETQADDDSGEIARELDLPPPRRTSPVVPQVSAPPASQLPVAKRVPDRPSRSAVPPATSAGPPARPVIVPPCFCDRGDSLCACFP